jgi:hypothetical protein
MDSTAVTAGKTVRFSSTAVTDSTIPERGDDGNGGRGGGGIVPTTEKDRMVQFLGWR